MKNIKSGATFEDAAVVAIATNEDGTRRVLALGAEAKGFPSMEEKKIVFPFKHNRVIIGDFEAGQALMQYAIAQVVSSRSAFLPVIVVHWTDKLDGGITPIEARALHEMAASCGAAKVYVSAENHIYSDDEVKALAADFL